MKELTFLLLVLLASIGATAARAQALKYPPLSDYLMPQDAEIAFARSAAPASVSDRATIKVLTKSGYEVARQGDNGSVCVVMRGFSAPTYTPAQFREIVYDPTIHAPICFTAPAARMVMPYYELRTKLAIEGKGRTRLPRAFKRHMSKEISRKETTSVLLICGQRIRILDRELVIGIPM